MRKILLALTSELRRLKAAGVKTVPVSADTISAFKSVVRARASGVAAVDATASYSKPVPKPDAVHESPSRADSGFPPPPVVTLPSGDKHAQMDWLRDRVLNDPVCLSHVRPGKRLVVGVGNLDAKIFFCGEAPGADEEIQGEPFVGPAGQLLNRMIHGMGLKREEVYIGNIMNWRPDVPTHAGMEQSGNRPPTAEEMAYCLPYLKAQLQIVNPDVIVALGATAGQGLLGMGSFKTLREIRGRWKLFSEKPVMVTYHPSYVLRNESNRVKRAVWEDLLQVMERIGLPISDKQRGFFLNK
ncbi:MAG: uracil-DNA glycosylase [Opitutaceae bacterium]|nr:uracil-DNA glycosylase [Opitutaceae bacterium]